MKDTFKSSIVRFEGALLSRSFAEWKEQAEGIAITRDCIGTCSLLSEESIREEGLKQGGKAGHYRRASLPLSRRRFVAN